MKAGWSWLLAMAWRDVRQAKRRLLLFALSVVAGVAALVAITSFRTNLADAMDQQSAKLLGADVEYDSKAPLGDDAERLLAEVGAVESSEEVAFATMAFFPKNESTRIVRARAMEGGFPWYGKLDTRPVGLSVADATEPVALVDESLMLQFDLELGDTVRIGNLDLKIIGEVLRIPGDGAFSGTFAPRVLFPKAFLRETGLVRFGSRLKYTTYHRFDPEDADAAALRVEERRDALEESGVEVETVADQKRRLGRTLDGMNSFLSMVGFVALLLGGVAIAGAVSVYLKGKTASVAVLRCLGVSAHRAMLIFTVQVAAVGAIGCFLGAVVGVLIQQGLPAVLAGFLPFPVEAELAWGSLLFSTAFAWSFTSLFGLLPLLPLRRVSPLSAIRVAVEKRGAFWKDPAALLVGAILTLLSFGFAVTQTQSAMEAVSFFLGIGLALLVLAFVGWLLRAALRRLSVSRFPFVWRQGLANLHRPNNRTTLLIVTLGMGAFLIYTLYLSEQSLLAQGEMAYEEGQPNMILFDIQPDQLAGVNEIVDRLQVDAIPAEPIVTMRLLSLNGLSAAELEDQDERKIEDWALQREFRSTFRDFLQPDEELTEGEFTPYASLDSGDIIPISVEARIVEALSLKMGDVIVWDVQGFPIETRVDSIRKVDWREMRPNFFVVFPAGVLEDAPAFYVTAAQAPDAEKMVELQTAVVKAFPNVSVVNLSLVIESLSELLDTVSFVVRFMASFTIVTGIIALIASVVTSRYQRLSESALLRTLGASASQVRAIMGVEYLLVGLLAGVAGIGLALLGGWAVAHFALKVELYVPWLGTLFAVVIVAATTLAAGLLNSWGIARHSPLEAIRSD